MNKRKTTAGSDGQSRTTSKATVNDDSSATTRKNARRRGRPPGSVSLTREIHDKIVNYTRGGAMVHVAARAAGIDARTFREWMQRGEDRHPHRESCLKLRRFARDVRTAQAEARVATEIRVNQEDPKFWLRYVARSRPGDEGWTEPRPDEVAPGAETFDARSVLAARIEMRVAAKQDRPEGYEIQPSTERPPLRVVESSEGPAERNARRRGRAS